MPKEDILPKDFMPKVKICSDAWRAFSGLKSAICIFQQNLSKIMGFLIKEKIVRCLKLKIGQNRLISGQIFMHFVSLCIGDVSLMIICHIGQKDLLGMLSSWA